MAGNGFEVRRLSGAIGAEILGIDLASDPGDNVIGDIRQAWLEHNVIFFRDQDLPPAKFLAFAKRFGEVVEYPFIKGIEGFPEIIPVVKLEHETKNFGGIWHTDTAYLDTPPMATMLIAREVPPLRRRHAVRQHLSRLRDAVRRHEAHARRADRGQSLGQGRRHAHARGSRARRRQGRSQEGISSASIRWCAPIRRPGARRSTSMSGTPCASRT